jgi:hypothetical protein
MKRSVPADGHIAPNTVLNSAKTFIVIYWDALFKDRPTVVLHIPPVKPNQPYHCRNDA